MTGTERNTDKGSRRDELAANLVSVEQRIASACASAGRSRDEISLIVVTKTYPASDVGLLAELGVTDVGENRHPEAQLKLEALLAMEANPSKTLPRCHFVGGLQTNKANAVTRYADVIHSVDRLKLVKALDRGAASAGRSVTCLVQVGLSEGAGRSGATPADVPAIAEAIDAAEHLILGGVMAVAPLGVDAKTAFDELRSVSLAVRGKFPHASMISAGMSGDLEQAIQAGATHLRIGRSVLGERPLLG